MLSHHRYCVIAIQFHVITFVLSLYRAILPLASHCRTIASSSSHYCILSSPESNYQKSFSDQDLFVVCHRRCCCWHCCCNCFTFSPEPMGCFNPRWHKPSFGKGNSSFFKSRAALSLKRKWLRIIEIFWYFQKIFFSKPVWKKK